MTLQLLPREYGVYMMANIPNLDEIREWLLDLRSRNNLTQPDVDRLTREMGERYRISQSYLSQLERGIKLITDLSAERLDALRRVYKISPEEWVSKTGLTIVTRESLEVADSEKTSPLTFPFESKLPIPDTLLEAAAEYGDEYPELRDPKWQQSLAGIRFENGMTVGPQTPEHWVDAYLLLKKFRRHTR